jgi:putative tricarboxylic transport membrane protein
MRYPRPQGTKQAPGNLHRAIKWVLIMDGNKKEQISSLLLLLFSIFLCIFSYKLSVGSLNNPQEGFFPFYLGIILGLLSIRNFTKAVVRRKIAIEKIKTLGIDINWKNIIITIIVLFSYPLLLNILGFLASTFLFTVLFLRLINPQRWLVVLGMGGSVAIIFYFIFQYWLKVQFPSGIFGV